MNLQTSAAAKPAASRVARIGWDQAAADLGQRGSAVLEKLLSWDECQAVASLYSNDSWFRSRVVMERHGFGKGEYKYFGYPLPELIADLRNGLYSRFAPIANTWSKPWGLPRVSRQSIESS